MRYLWFLVTLFCGEMPVIPGRQGWPCVFTTPPEPSLVGATIWNLHVENIWLQIEPGRGPPIFLAFLYRNPASSLVWFHDFVSMMDRVQDSKHCNDILLPGYQHRYAQTKSGMDINHHPLQLASNCAISYKSGVDIYSSYWSYMGRFQTMPAFAVASFSCNVFDTSCTFLHQNLKQNEAKSASVESTNNGK